MRNGDLERISAALANAGVSVNLDSALGAKPIDTEPDDGPKDVDLGSDSEPDLDADSTKPAAEDAGYLEMRPSPGEHLPHARILEVLARLGMLHGIGSDNVKPAGDELAPA